MTIDELLHHQYATDGDTAANCGGSYTLTLKPFGRPREVTLSPAVSN